MVLCFFVLFFYPHGESALGTLKTLISFINSLILPSFIQYRCADTVQAASQKPGPALSAHFEWWEREDNLTP